MVDSVQDFLVVTKCFIKSYFGKLGDVNTNVDSQWKHTASESFVSSLLSLLPGSLCKF